jgi:rhodanese-related sulfurtransferase
MNKKLMLAIFIAFVLSFFCGESNIFSNSASPPKISSAELYSRIQAGEKIVIFDVREENEYVGKHIPDAIWLPKSRFDRQDPEVLKKLEAIDKEIAVVTYCGAGHRSNYVARKLREMGFNAYNLDGISFWEKEGYPLVSSPKLSPSEEPSIIHLEEAYENYYLLFKDVVWIDVRNEQDYREGHIKGALGIPLSGIEGRLNEIPQDKEIVLYCEGTWDGGSCGASKSAGRILIKSGFNQGKIKVFEDGYGAWENARHPVETVTKKIESENIYSEFICDCCGKAINLCNCPMASDRKAYVDSLLNAEFSKDEIYIKMAEKFGIAVLASKEKQDEIKAKLFKDLNSKYAKISVIPEEYDFGQVSLSKGIVKTSFIIKNTGEANLIINNIKTSCGCTVASLKIKNKEKSPDFSVKGKTSRDWQVEILPEQEVELVIGFDPNFYPPKIFPHQVTRKITISSNDPIASKKVIKIKAELVE